MKHEQQIVIKRWVPILEEYEKTRTKQRPRVFKSLKALCEAHHISTKELRRYYRVVLFFVFLIFLGPLFRCNLLLCQCTCLLCLRQARGEGEGRFYSLNLVDLGIDLK